MKIMAKQEKQMNKQKKCSIRGKVDDPHVDWANPKKIGKMAPKKRCESLICEGKSLLLPMFGANFVVLLISPTSAGAANGAEVIRTAGGHTQIGVRSIGKADFVILSKKSVL